MIILESYVDDFFGGPKQSKGGLKADKIKAQILFNELIAVGELTGAIMNLEKCCPPAQKMVILGFLYDSIAKTCRLSEQKREKYINRIDDILNSEYIKIKVLEKIVGNLTYAAWVSPFGRPFLSV